MKFWRTPLAIRTIHDSPTDLAKWLELARAPGGLTAETAEAEFRRDLGKALRSDVKIDWAEVAEHFNATASLEGVLTKVGRPFELELVHRGGDEQDDDDDPGEYVPSKAVLEAEREELSAEDLIKVYTSAMHPDSASPVAGPEAEALHGQMQREMAAAKKAAGGRAILWEVPSL